MKIKTFIYSDDGVDLDKVLEAATQRVTEWIDSQLSCQLTPKDIVSLSTSVVLYVCPDPKLSNKTVVITQLLYQPAS